MNVKTTRFLGQAAGFALGLSCALAASAGTPAIPSYSVDQAYTVGNVPMSVAAADFNGDGMADLVTVNWTDGTVSVLMNQATAGATTPNYAAPQTFAVGSGPTFVTAADLNGDGKPDIIVLNQANSVVTVLTNETPNGSATAVFDAPVTFATGFYPQSLAIADINGDGLPDLVVANYGDYTISVLLNTTASGQLSFAPQQVTAVNGGPYAIETVDLNGDGLPDVVVTEMASGAVSVLLNTTIPGPASTTTVNFAPQQDYVTGDFPTSVAVADLNGDGLLDLAVVNEGDNSISVFMNNGSSTAPSYAAQQVIQVGNGPEAVVAADVDGDGNPDLLVLNLDDNDVQALMNITSTSGATYTYNSYTFGIGSGANSLITADLNGDGKPDVATANEIDNTVSVLFNTTP